MSRFYIDQSSRVYVDKSSRLFVINPIPVISPLYSLWVESLTANETTANTITFYLSAQNINVIDFPISVPFKVIGEVDENDFLVGTQLSGTFVLLDNNTIASQTFEVLADSTTEGDETMTLVLTSVADIACPSEAENLSQSVLIYDTSLFPPGYTLSINPAQANETTSNVFDIKLTTTGVANGTKIPFMMTGVGISAVDFTGVTALTGFFEVTGATVPPDLTPVVTTRTYTITADHVTEGTEVLTVTLSSAGGISCPIEAEGLSKQISIFDTSGEVGTVSLLLNANGPNGGSNTNITDNSTNAKTLVRTGDVYLAGDTPFNDSGASVYFDGKADDYLYTTGDTMFAFGTGDFTIEFWCKTNTASLDGLIQRRIISYSNNSANGMQVFICGDNSLAPIGSIVFATVASPVVAHTTDRVDDNEWHHVAFCRSSGQLSCYLDGALKSTVAFTGNISTTAATFYIGAKTSSSGNWKGFISNLRLVKGTSIYSGSSITIPTSPLTNIANTSLLVNPMSASIIDSAKKNPAIFTQGNVQTTTSVKKYGSSSLAFDGTNDWLYMPGGSQFAYGTGDFTIEFWCNFTRVTVPSDATNPRILSQGTNASNRLQIYIEDVTTGSGGTGIIGEFVLYTGSTIGKTNTAVNDGNWHHIAFARQNGIMRTFVDGVLKDTRANSTNFNDNTTGYTIGSYNNSTLGDYLGYIDDFRITKGAALYTSNFTPPTEELTVIT